MVSTTVANKGDLTKNYELPYPYHCYGKSITSVAMFLVAVTFEELLIII